MTALLNRITPAEKNDVLKSLLPTSKAKAAPKAKAKRPTKSQVVESLSGIRKGISVALGVAIPGMSLTLSHIAGTLAPQTPWLAGLVGACGISVLIVSLSHLAEAIEDSTGSAKWQAWALAITIDVAVIACELTHVFTADASLWFWTTGLMVVVMLFSMALNTYAFLKHAR